MKNILRAIPLLLLSLCLFLSGCAQDAETATGTPDNTPPQSEAPTDPNEIYGIWFSKSANAALEIIKENNQAKYYSIVRGYYAYYDLQTTTYTYDKDECMLTLTLADEAFVFEYDEDMDTLTCEEIVYERQTDAPTQHPVYPFPDYAAIDCSDILTLPELDAETIYRYAKSDAAREIFKSHYSNGLSKCPKITDRAAEYGDIVIVDYEGKRNGVPFSKGTASNQEIAIAYSNGYIPGFAEGIVGHSVGETFDVPVRFPDVYPSSPDLAGQEVVFTMTLHTIYDVRLSEAQMATYTQLPYETWDEWVDAAAKEMIGSLALTELYEEAIFSAELPKETYLFFYQNYVDQIYSYAAYMNIDPETYVQTYYHVTLEQYKALALDNAKSYAYNYVICHEFAKQEDLTWSAEEYQALFDSYVKKLTDRGYAKEFAENYVNTNQKKQIETELICQVVENWLGESLQSRLGA